MSSAVLQGTVLFSTRIAPGLAWMAISLVTASNAVTSVARPAPSPLIFVGVLTAIRIMSASLIVFEISVEKKRFGTRAGMCTSSLCSPHWLSHSELAELVVDMLSKESDLVASLTKEHAFDPSRAIRRISCRPGS